MRLQRSIAAVAAEDGQNQFTVTFSNAGEESNFHLTMVTRGMHQNLSRRYGGEESQPCDSNSCRLLAHAFSPMLSGCKTLNLC